MRPIPRLSHPANPTRSTPRTYRISLRSWLLRTYRSPRNRCIDVPGSRQPSERPRSPSKGLEISSCRIKHLSFAEMPYPMGVKGKQKDVPVRSGSMLSLLLSFFRRVHRIRKRKTQGFSHSQFDQREVYNDEGRFCVNSHRCFRCISLRFILGVDTPESVHDGPGDRMVHVLHHGHRRSFRDRISGGENVMEGHWGKYGAPFAPRTPIERKLA